MDNQTEQQKQNLNQNQEQGSDSSKYKIKIEVGEPVNISSTDQINPEDYQSKEKVIEQPQKSKRPRKTIEQEIAELDAKRERLMEKKRRQDAHEKIVFGSICIKIFGELSENDKNSWNEWKIRLNQAIADKDMDILNRIINNIENPR